MTGQQLGTPGVYVERRFDLPRQIEFRTGVPVFLGKVTPLGSKPGAAPDLRPHLLTAWPRFKALFEAPNPDHYLAYAVRGFFENGGEQCYVAPVASVESEDLREARKTVGSLTNADLVCIPDLFVPGSPWFEGYEEKEGDLIQRVGSIQRDIIKECAKLGGRFAILDTHPACDWKRAWENWSSIEEIDGALYYPWIRVRRFDDTEFTPPGTRSPLPQRPTGSPFIDVPPCGHIAGVYARTDRLRGVHKAPANEVLNGVVDLSRHVTMAEQNLLNPKGINCIRAFPGRGIRVWGARTSSGPVEWKYINVRRIFLTAIRWIEWNMWDIAFEPNDTSLWARIERELTSYFNGQYRRGALKGATARDSFYVKCDNETNSAEYQNQGQVITEIGLATAVPFEFVVVRLILGTTGVQVQGPTNP